MPGSAVLDPDVLVDDLVGSLIDDLRDTLHPEFGVRAYRVFTLLRTWDGGEISEGAATDVETELTPQPLVKSFVNSLGQDLEPCGLDEAGTIILREVSLSYTYDELTGGDLEHNQEWLIILKEAHGQGQPDRAFVVETAPFVDRVKDMGWQIRLRRAH